MDTDNTVGGVAIESTQLLGCPFCGKPVEMRYTARAYEIWCEPCDLIFPTHGCVHKFKLIELWNHRQPNASLSLPSGERG
jgi:hypothetical protein